MSNNVYYSFQGEITTAHIKYLCTKQIFEINQREEMLQ